MDPVEWLTRPVPAQTATERPVHLNDGYQDFVLCLSAQELRTWHARDRHLAFEGVYEYSGWRDQLDPKIAELERVLESPDCPTLLVAHWLEWESGLG